MQNKNNENTLYYVPNLMIVASLELHKKQELELNKNTYQNENKIIFKCWNKTINTQAEFKNRKAQNNTKTKTDLKQLE